MKQFCLLRNSVFLILLFERLHGLLFLSVAPQKNSTSIEFNYIFLRKWEFVTPRNVGQYQIYLYFFKSFHENLDCWLCRENQIEISFKYRAKYIKGCFWKGITRRIFSPFLTFNRLTISNMMMDAVVMKSDFAQQILAPGFF